LVIFQLMPELPDCVTPQLCSRSSLVYFITVWSVSMCTPTLWRSAKERCPSKCRISLYFKYSTYKRRNIPWAWGGLTQRSRIPRAPG